MNTSIGVSKPYYAKYNPNSGSPTYSTGASLGMATECSITVDGKDPAILYADNGAAESVATFGGGTVTVGVHKLTLAHLIDLLGQTYSASSGATFKADINAPYVGVGIVAMIFMTYFPLRFVQCKQPDVTLVTKGDTVEYQVPSLEFAILRDDSADAKWMWMQDGYGTEALAEAAVKSALGIT